MVRLVVHVEELTGQGSIKCRFKVPYIMSDPLQRAERCPGTTPRYDSVLLNNIDSEERAE